MNKNFRYYGIVWLIFAAVFNAVVFLAPNEAVGLSKFGGAFWLGYILVMLAFAGQLVCAYKAFSAESPQELFYRLPYITLSYSGLIVTLIAGAVCMAVPFFPNWLGGVIGIIIFGVTAASVVKAAAVADTVGAYDKKTANQTFEIKSLVSDAEQLMKTAGNGEIREKCRKVYEALRYSDPVSTPQLSEINAQIRHEFSIFEIAASGNDTHSADSSAKNLLQLIESRNQKCRLMKHSN